MQPPCSQVDCHRGPMRPGLAELGKQATKCEERHIGPRRRASSHHLVLVISAGCFWDPALILSIKRLGRPVEQPHSRLPSHRSGGSPHLQHLCLERKQKPLPARTARQTTLGSTSPGSRGSPAVLLRLRLTASHRTQHSPRPATASSSRLVLASLTLYCKDSKLA